MKNQYDPVNSKHLSNCEELRTRFEGREAIYVECGALRVRVNNIHPRGGFRIRADAEEIPTPGLGVGMFHRPPPIGTNHLRFKIGAGYLTTFSQQSWKLGYGGWSLYFAPEIIQAVVGFAAQLPKNADPDESYRHMCRLPLDLGTHERDQLVFPDVVEPWTGAFRKNDSPAITVEVSSGWVTCPYCDMRFMLSYSQRWDGDRHITCGQRLFLNAD